MAKKRFSGAIVVLCLAVLSCNLQSGQDLQGVQATLVALGLTQTAQAALLAPTSSPTVGAATAGPSATTCPAIVTASLNANVRNGPGTVYDPPVGQLLTGQTAPIAGKNSEGTWWYINFPSGPGGFGWIAASTVTTTCVPVSVAIVAAPPTPRPPSGTCKDDYVWRRIKSSDKVCVSSGSKAQADADNGAADSRLCTAAYGADTCAQGYVWREAFSGDHVCVVPATRSQASADNSAASSNWVSGAYGPHTCVSGLVWREATGSPSDDVCVTAATRSQAASDNAAAASHLCTAAYGPKTCAQGYVWRQAFSGDYVCVTPAVRNQVAADNADAPSHTWH